MPSTLLQILIGDVRTHLARLPSESVHCIVTSPPYFGLRSYLPADHHNKHCELGAEATPDAYVAELVGVFRKARRVLRADGTFWLNLGDLYSNAGTRMGNVASKANERSDAESARTYYVPNVPGFAAKQRLMIPARVALALQSDGWWLRDEIIWHKPNPMPVSVTDRTTPAHEMLYMLTKSARYFYDMEAVKEPIAEASRRRYAQPRALSGEQTGGEKSDAYESITMGSRRPNEIVSSLARRAKDQLDAARNPNSRPHSLSEFEARNATYPAVLRQPRSVWTIATRPFKGAHFATFPPDLVRPCILAGSPRGGVVLDPFGGAGTTALVARQLGRRSILIELNPAYAFMAAARCAA